MALDPRHGVVQRLDMYSLPHHLRAPSLPSLPRIILNNHRKQKHCRIGTDGTVHWSLPHGGQLDPSSGAAGAYCPIRPLLRHFPVKQSPFFFQSVYIYPYIRIHVYCMVLCVYVTHTHTRTHLSLSIYNIYIYIIEQTSDSHTTLHSSLLK